MLYHVRNVAMLGPFASTLLNADIFFSHSYWITNDYIPFPKYQNAIEIPSFWNLTRQ